MIRLLKASGVEFPGNQNLKFRRLDPTTGALLVHAEGEWLNGTDATRNRPPSASARRPGT